MYLVLFLINLLNFEVISGKMLKVKLKFSVKGCKVFCYLFLLRNENESLGLVRERDFSYYIRFLVERFRWLFFNISVKLKFIKFY